MLINKRCTVCGDKTSEGQTTTCGSCGKIVHERCVEYERNFECSDCAVDGAVGAVEF